MEENRGEKRRDITKRRVGRNRETSGELGDINCGKERTRQTRDIGRGGGSGGAI